MMKQAARLFAAKSFNGASVADISKACNVSKSLIYHYYNAKEDILYGVMKDHLDDLIEIISRPSLRDEDATQEFHQLTQALMQCYAGAEDAQRVLLYELGSLTTAQRKVIVEQQRAIIDRFEGVYLRIAPEYEGRRALLRSKIMLFFGSLNWVHTWHNPDGEISRETLATLAVANILGES